MPAAFPEVIIGGGFAAEIHPADRSWEPEAGLSFQLGKYIPINRDAGIYFDGFGDVSVNLLTGETAGTYDLAADVSLLAERLYIRWLVGSSGSLAPENGNLGFETALYLSLGNDLVSFSLDPRFRLDLLPASAFGAAGDARLSWAAGQKLLMELALPFELRGEAPAGREESLGVILGFSYYPQAFWVLDGECGIRRETSTELGTVDTVEDLPVGSFWELTWDLDLSLAPVGSTVFTLALPGHLRRKDHAPVVGGVLQTGGNQWDLQLEPGLQIYFPLSQNVGIETIMAASLLHSSTPALIVFTTIASLTFEITL
jgi:hypothetical protein